MTAVYLLPTVLSLLVLAAHFLRMGSLPLVMPALALLPLLLVRRWWARRVVQACLVLGALEWVRATLALAAQRREIGQPYERMALILGAVVAVTLLAALLLETPRLRRWFAPRGAAAGAAENPAGDAGNVR